MRRRIFIVILFLRPCSGWKDGGHADEQSVHDGVLRPSDAKETPQCLLSAREDVMKDLAKSDKTYQKIYRKLYEQKNLHVITGTTDFINWENKVDPDIEKALDTAAGK